MLHKTSKVRGFHIFAIDGEIGHVDDFLFDEEAWCIRHLVVDTSNWMGGKSVLIAAEHVVEINSPLRRVRVGLTRDEIKQAPPVESADVELIETLPPAII